MDTNIIIGILALFVAFGVGGFIIYLVFFSDGGGKVSSMMGVGSATKSEFGRGIVVNEEDIAKKVDAFKKARSSSAEKLSLEDKLFRAGIFSQEQKAKFYKIKRLGPFGGVGLGVLAYFATFDLLTTVACLIVGVLCGFQLPLTIIDRKIESRADDILYYLPLVIEQISIGVSRSLDIGPCVTRVVQMARERDSVNVVTELLAHVQNFVKSGESLEVALRDIGELCGHPELKHTFNALSQVARHGGEVTKQLQELADAVSLQRETKIEEKIKKLELKATGPVAFVFVGFMMILLVGFGIQISEAF